MITCDNCGFGHRTFEELRECKPWAQIVAEAKARGEDVLGNPLSTFEDHNAKSVEYFRKIGIEVTNEKA